MNKIIILILLAAPAVVGAQERTPVSGAKSPVAEDKTVKKPDTYQTIAVELLKDCEGVDKKIAVAGFSYSDGRDSKDSSVVSERITTNLVKAKKIKVIERKEIEKVFEELKLQRSGAINPDSAKEIGKMVGADWVVVGTLIELPDKQLELNARLVGVESGEIINAVNFHLKKDWVNQDKELLEGQNKSIVKIVQYKKAEAAAASGKYGEALKTIRPFAEKGDAQAQVDLGTMYLAGRGVSKDYAEAAKWFRKAAEQDVIVAEAMLGSMYLIGQGVIKDHVEAVKWSRKAAEHGDAWAQNNLGVLYTAGEDIRHDYIEAYKWFMLSAAQGNEKAKEAMNDPYLGGKLTQMQLNEAKRRATSFRPSSGN